MPAKPPDPAERQGDDAPLPEPPGPGIAPFPIVAIGASAGGLEAFQKLLSTLPADTGMAFVYIQHSTAGHESLLPQIFARATRLPVVLVDDAIAVRPDHLYLAPPAHDLAYREGRLEPGPRSEKNGVRHPIDGFMRSLAGEQAHLAVGVVLSGMATDGTLGLQDIKYAGGITFAQDSTAEHSGMPESAIASGSVDLVLPPDEIGRELGRISRHPFVRTVAAPPDALPEEDAAATPQILELLRGATGVDFSHYKPNTLQRRIARRMLLHCLERRAEYVKVLRQDPRELQALYQDILINVTSFFRNPEAFEAVQRKVFPRLVKSHVGDDPVRVWVVGCSTGEEAYSIAIAYHEFAEANPGSPGLQVFATDLNAQVVERARAGVYPKSIASDITPQRLHRYFQEAGGEFRVRKVIRDMCIFARHNMLSDPPFSRIDLATCRNVLIYLERVLQQQLLPVLHYALRPGGCLWLGSSETIGSYRDLFDLDDAKHKLYSRREGSGRFLRSPIRGNAADPALPRPAAPQAARERLDPNREADQLLLSRYAPPGVVLDDRFEVLQFRGDTGPFLMPAPGRASLSLLKMLREGLLVAVRGALHRAQRENLPVREEGLRVLAPAGYRVVNVAVIPLRGGGPGSMVVIFEDLGESGTERARRSKQESDSHESAEAEAASQQTPQKEIERLTQELNATREYLHAVIEQQEAANEELQSAHEESQSANEELQSINEELETSKEELQSSNEELTTINDELQARNAELAHSNDDLLNLLANVQMPIVMLDAALRIRRFTPAAEELLNLVPADEGRLITEMTLNLEVPDLDEVLAEVVRGGRAFERAVRDRKGRWMSLRARQYRTAAGKAEGAVLVLVDIDAIKRTTQALQEAEQRFARMADSAPVLFWVHSAKGIEFVNRTYEEFLGVGVEALRGDDWARLVHPEDRAGYVAAFGEALARGGNFVAMCRLRRKDGEYRWVKSVGTPRFDDDGKPLGLIGTSLDVTDLKEAERAKNEFIGVLSHELRNPLAAISSAAAFLSQPGQRPADRQKVVALVERQAATMTRLVDDLLDVSRITHGKIQLRLQPLDLVSAVKAAAGDVSPLLAEARQQLALTLPGGPIWVDADPVRVEQIFINLLRNASKFTPEEGHIGITMEVGAGAADGFVSACVHDDGMGIEPGEIAHIFDLFAQGERAVQHPVGGMGIGLTITRSLVEMHGGSIEARSPGPGRGSEFIVRLPLRAAGPARGVRRPAARPVARRVLLVEDHPDVAGAMEAYLVGIGHTVRVVGEGLAVQEAAREYRPEVVLLDIGLPDLNGYQVARRLRDDPATKGMRLVALTGFGRHDDAARAKAAGFDAHVAKPASPEALVRAMDPSTGWPQTDAGEPASP